jgi:hypothetical protein
MAAAAANDAVSIAMCALDADTLPATGMTTMYLLMSLVHLPPWLNLACRGHAPDR